MLPHWLIKVGFHLLYHQMAWSYDLVAWSVSFGEWAAWRRLSLQFVQPGPILELAHGTGGLFLDMLERGYSPIGVDLSPYMSRLAGRRLKQRNIASRLSRSKAQRLPFPSGIFTSVIATFPTPYIFEPETLAEVQRVLRPADKTNNQPAGRLIIVMEGQLRGPQPIRGFIDWLYRITNQQDFSLARPLSIFEEHDLKARWELVEAQGVMAKLIVAEKNDLNHP